MPYFRFPHELLGCLPGFRFTSNFQPSQAQQHPRLQSISVSKNASRPKTRSCLLPQLEAKIPTQVTQSTQHLSSSCSHCGKDNDQVVVPSLSPALPRTTRDRAPTWPPTAQPDPRNVHAIGSMPYKGTPQTSAHGACSPAYLPWCAKTRLRWKNRGVRAPMWHCDAGPSACSTPHCRNFC